MSGYPNYTPPPFRNPPPIEDKLSLEGLESYLRDLLVPHLGSAGAERFVEVAGMIADIRAQGAIADFDQRVGEALRRNAQRLRDENDG